MLALARKPNSKSANAWQVWAIPEFNELAAKRGKISHQGKKLDGDFPPPPQYQPLKSRKEAEDATQRGTSTSQEPSTLPPHPPQGLQNTASLPVSSEELEKNNQIKPPETARIITGRKQQVSHPHFYSLVMWSHRFRTSQQQHNRPKACLSGIVSAEGKRINENQMKSTYHFFICCFPQHEVRYSQDQGFSRTFRSKPPFQGFSYPMNLLQNKKLEQDFLWVYTVSLTTVYHTYQNKHIGKLFTFSFRVQSCPVRNSRHFSAISDFTRLCHFPLLSDLILHIQSQPVKQDLSAFLLHFPLKKEKPMQLPGLLT